MIPNHGHICAACGGQMQFSYQAKEKIRTKSGKVIIRQKEYHTCLKCGNEVNCMRFPSYDEMVMNHMFPKDLVFIPFYEYKRVMKAYNKWDDKKKVKK